MTNKELLDKIREEILHLKMKELQRTNGVNTGADVYLSSYAVLSILSNALTEESEDERIRKWLVDYFSSIKKTVWIHRDMTCEQILDWLEKQKEQKPILEVFGFKVGDAVRLKDGDGRKHIIKSFEEVEGVHGPNFYQVEFEDNSARDGIYPGEEYPNGYYTQMEKFEEEQKPASTEDMPYITDEHFYEREPVDSFKYKLAEYMTRCCTKKEGPYGYEYGISAESILKMAEEELLKRGVVQKSAEWSEEDEKMLKQTKDILFVADAESDANNSDYSSRKFRIAQSLSWLDIRLKSLRPQPHWKPSEEQMRELKLAVNDSCRNGLASLYNDLLKLTDNEHD